MPFGLLRQHSSLGSDLVGSLTKYLAAKRNKDFVDRVSGVLKGTNREQTLRRPKIVDAVMRPHQRP
jgi:hypothetical protein